MAATKTKSKPSSSSSTAKKSSPKRTSAPKDTKALAKRLDQLDAEIDKLAEDAYVLNNSTPAGDAADGYVRVLREMRRVLLRAKEQGHLVKLNDA
jgi:hypothetical protein